MGNLDGKVALISGTARGMGRAAAVEFAAQGAAVFGCDLDRAQAAMLKPEKVGHEGLPSWCPFLYRTDRGTQRRRQTVPTR